MTDNQAQGLHARQANTEMGCERGTPCEVRDQNCHNNQVVSRPGASGATDDEWERATLLDLAW